MPPLAGKISSRFDSLRLLRHELRPVSTLQNAKTTTRMLWRAAEAVSYAMDPGDAANNLRNTAKAGLNANQWREEEPLVVASNQLRFVCALITLILSAAGGGIMMAAKRNALGLAKNRAEESMVYCACSGGLARIGAFIAALAAADEAFCGLP